jgi:tetratricopeptide (TPR) repeat protein
MDIAEALFDEAVRNEAEGDFAAAELLYRGLLQQQPTDERAALGLGSLLSRTGRAEDALAWLQRAAARPSVALYAALGKLHEQGGRSEAAVNCYLIATLLQATSLAPPDAAHWLQLGMALHRTGPQHAAAAAFRAALLTDPGGAALYNNLAALCDGAAALALQRRAVQLAPADPAFHTNLAHALLAAGMFDQGFAEWEWRTPSPPRVFAAPRWQGQDLHGRILLVHAEQGYGDSIQFCRYVPRLARLGGKVMVETRAPLAGLLGRVTGVDQVTLWGASLPPFDLQIALPSLAARFPWAPARRPYLTADRARKKIWRLHLEAAGVRRYQRKIGLVWAGNPRSVDPRRALDFPGIATLAYSDPESRFYSLQREERVADSLIVDLGDMVEDFDDLAAALCGLDLLISVDTAAAHLAGALGRPVWVLLHSDADWRWRSDDGGNSVWYPTARVYRQSRAGDWHDVLQRVARDLALGK